MVDVSDIISEDKQQVVLDGNLAAVGQVDLSDADIDLESVEKVMLRVFKLKKEEQVMILMALIDKM